MTGLLLAANSGEPALALSREGYEDVVERSRVTLAAAGISSGERSVLSLSSEGDFAGALLSDAMVRQGSATALVGPRGRLRLLAAIRELRPKVWVTTPSGALDFLARLYLEFNVDPMELEIERIVVLGEIASPGTFRRLADEFEAEVTGLYCDPFFACALAHSAGGAWQVDHPDVLALASLDVDECHPIEAGRVQAAPEELILRPTWSSLEAAAVLRTGQVVASPGAEVNTFFQHTVGQHLLVRGRWLSLPLLQRALSQIDGTVARRVHVSRGAGTLDKLTITLGFDRDSLVENEMWAARAREAIVSATPIAFELQCERASENDPEERVVDERGHHLGADRLQVVEPVS
jgi:phenylacetate-CoA ligase